MPDAHMPKIELVDGLILFQSHLSPAEQRELWAMCRAHADGPAPMYTPAVRGGNKMSVGMRWLGNQCDGLTSNYADRRSGLDGCPAAEIRPRRAPLAQPS